MAIRKAGPRSAAVVAALVAGLTLTAVQASAQQTTGISVSPTSVQTAAIFAPTSGVYEGDAGVVTVTIGANTVLQAGQPLRFEECNLDPTSQANCDGATAQTTAVGSSAQVIPAADGSVSFTMLVWELPTGQTPDTYDTTDRYTNNQYGFDPGSIVTCDDAETDTNLGGAGVAHLCSIWVGDSPAAWSSNSFVFNDISVEAAPLGGAPPPPPQLPEVPYLPLLPVLGAIIGGGLLVHRRHNALPQRRGAFL